MMKKYLLILCKVAFLLHVIKADTLYNNNAKLNAKLETNNKNVIVQGKYNYIKLDYSERITLTCSKTIESPADGTMLAFVNTQTAKQSFCQTYLGNRVEEEKFCLVKQFIFVLESDRSSYFDIECRFAETRYSNISASIFLHRLYQDNLPRIRSHLTLDSLNATVLHYINTESVSCEAMRDLDENKPSFDSIQWFSVESSKSLGFTFSTIPITSTLLNYSSEFPSDSHLAKNNTSFKCCTMLKGDVLTCQQFLALVYSPPTTTTTTTTTTSTSTNEVTKKATKPTAKTTSTSTEKPKSASTSFKTKLFEVFNSVKAFSSSTFGLNNKGSNEHELSDSEVGIIIACVGGAVVLFLIFMLALLCYKRKRYGSMPLYDLNSKEKSSQVRRSNQSNLNNQNERQLSSRLEESQTPETQMRSIELYEKNKMNKKQKKKKEKNAPKDVIYPRETSPFDQTQTPAENISVIGVYNSSQKAPKTSKQDSQFELREKNEIEAKSQQSKKKKSFFSSKSSKSKQKEDELGKVKITIVDNSAPLPPPPPASLFNDYSQSASNSASFPPPPPPPLPAGSMSYNKNSGSRKSTNEASNLYANNKSKQEQTGNEPMPSDFDYNDYIKQIDEQDEENESKNNNNVLY